ncbi:carbohydrate ABC transporter permease [Catenulispora yoronensis]|uniref:Carbohydrate ABC transporter permease n=1 Tax=Catenulispora yoronensis TaxID=450799 RepID=A0ABN2V4X9_9ACTN
MRLAQPRQSTRTTRLGGVRPARLTLHAFLILTSVVWLIPVAWALYTALRPFADTSKHGYVSVGGSYGVQNFSDAWSQADMLHFFVNTIVITVPALAVTLFFASMAAFVIARFRWRFNVALLVLFTAGNLLPQQAIITPLFRIYTNITLPDWMSDSGELYDSTLGLILIHVAFQTGFCVFVMSNYMKTIPREISEAAVVDGASVFRQYWQLTLPLCRPVLAALATLEFTWIYNDFYWATALISTGDKRPITAALANLQGEFFTNNNLVAAGSLLVAVPTLIVFFALQRHFIAGLTLGSSKG